MVSECLSKATEATGALPDDILDCALGKPRMGIRMLHHRLELAQAPRPISVVAPSAPSPERYEPCRGTATKTENEEDDLYCGVRVLTPWKKGSVNAKAQSRADGSEEHYPQGENHQVAHAGLHGG